MPPQQNIQEGSIPEYIQAGMRLAQPPPGEEIVISGLSGFFPDSADVYHFQENLFNKVDMVTDDDRRWKLGKWICCFVHLDLTLYVVLIDSLHYARTCSTYLSF